MPWDRDRFSEARDNLKKSPLYQRHLGIYAYRVGLLNRFVTWGESPIEQIECLEQLRVLWNGDRIHVAAACEVPPAGVDTEADLARVQAAYRSMQSEDIEV